jgi:FixJ family two-component response regulator
MTAQSKSICVYIVDDDASVRGALSRLMRAAGIRSREFVSPEEFLAVAESATTGCVLLDITMPGMTGNEMQARLRGMNFKLPVIVVSATENEEVRHTAYVLGAKLFLRKPVDGQALLDAIAWVTSTTESGAAVQPPANA